jgi:RNA polymerase primary sigma factor
MLSTYATWVIREVSIADHAPTIPILVHMIETINNIMCRSRQMFNEIDREPTAEELAQKLDGRPFVVGNSYQIGNEKDFRRPHRGQQRDLCRLCICR